MVVVVVVSVLLVGVLVDGSNTTEMMADTWPAPGHLEASQSAPSGRLHLHTSSLRPSSSSAGQPGSQTASKPTRQASSEASLEAC